MVHASSPAGFAKQKPRALAAPAGEPVLHFAADQRFGALAYECEQLAARHGKQEQLAQLLGVAVDAVLRLGVGWHPRGAGFSPFHACYTVPEYLVREAPCGIQRRYDLEHPVTLWDGAELASGDKRRLPGSCGAVTGLYGIELIGEHTTDPALICEGGSDTLAALSLGFAAVGKPQAKFPAGDQILGVLLRGRRAVIVRDNDDAGVEGAAETAQTLALACPHVVVVAPPTGIKDLRQWHSAGGTRADLLAAIDAAKPVRLGSAVRTRRVLR